jgi:NADH:ubiquinone oxidoreductase subunit 3 (subunit A)
MTSDWLYLAIFITISLVLPAAAILIAGLIFPKKPNAIKNSTYECGIETVGETWIQFKVQYYVYGWYSWFSMSKPCCSIPGRWPINN